MDFRMQGRGMQNTQKVRKETYFEDFKNMNSLIWIVLDTKLLSNGLDYQYNLHACLFFLLTLLIISK